MARGTRAVIGLALALLFFVVLATTFGAARISFIDALGILFTGSSTEPMHVKILWSIRLPRVLLAGLVGMGLAISGTTYQGLFKNPMAEPYVLGVSSGAALGATLAIITFGERTVAGLSTITFFAFTGALLTIFIVYQIAGVDKRRSVGTLLLAGIAISFFLSAMISLMMILNREAIEKVYLWTMGSVSAANWRKVTLLTPLILVGTGATCLFSRDLNVMLTGDNEAKSLGIEVETVRRILLGITSLMVAGAVSMSGIIGFVGLIVPHTLRILIGSDHRYLLPASALGGALFLILTDTIARSIIPPAEIPVGAITALFGAPYFIFLLLRKR